MKWPFKKEKDQITKTFDRETQKAVSRSSICTGEQVAGFKDLQTGKFEEVCLIRNDADKEAFMEMYGIRKEELTTEY